MVGFNYSFQGNQLTDEQIEFVNTALKGKNVLVDACIGSGKTTSIQALCNLLPNDKRILYLTYNKLLKVDAQSKITNQNAIVTNYHGFAFSTLRNNGISASIPELINAFNTNTILIQSFDVLIIDEYQDITTEISFMLQKIKDNSPGIQIVAVGDMSQKIYDFTTIDVKSFIEEFLDSYISLSLTTCFRLCEQHAKMLGRIWGKQITGINNNCIVEHMSFSQIRQVLLESEPKDILCLGDRNGKMADMLNDLEIESPQRFNKHTVFASIRDTDGYNTISPSNDNAIFTTFDSSKGLERSICVLFDWTDEYWTRRKLKKTSYEILRNIFCVAASRGKNRIILLDEKPLVTEQTLSTPYISNNTISTYFISEMFDFIYSEDIEACFNLLEVSLIEVEDKSTIRINTKDGLIDISPCIGVYQEAFYFTKYEIDKDAEYLARIKRFKNKNYNIPQSFYSDSLEKKVLYITSQETDQNRYYTQVSCPYVSNEKRFVLSKRLSTMLDQNEEIQKECTIKLKDTGSGRILTITGLCDALKDKQVYELKFVSELTHTHFLQCACYTVALNFDSGILWNTRTNTIFEIRIPNREAFLNAVVRAITKRTVNRCVRIEDYDIIKNNIAVIDTETSFSNKLISVGCVIAEESSLEIQEKAYYLIDPAYLEPAMYSNKLIVNGIEGKKLSRRNALEELISFLDAHHVTKIYAYNAKFDLGYLSELRGYTWIDIMGIAPYYQYNKTISREECNKSGRLIRGYGVEELTRRLLHDNDYCEEHNALMDAIDELRIMKLLNCPISIYNKAIIHKPTEWVNTLNYGHKNEQQEQIPIVTKKETEKEQNKHNTPYYQDGNKKQGIHDVVALTPFDWATIKKTNKQEDKQLSATIRVTEDLGTYSVNSNNTSKKRCKICGREAGSSGFATLSIGTQCICNECVLDGKLSEQDIKLIYYCPKCHTPITRKHNSIKCNSLYRCGWESTTDILLGKVCRNISENSDDSVSDLEKNIVKNGKYISFLKKEYFVPKESDWKTIYSLSQIRKIPMTEYQYVLAGRPLSPDLEVCDDEIIEFFEKHKNTEGKFSNIKTIDYDWIQSIADKNSMSVIELAALYGY